MSNNEKNVPESVDASRMVVEELLQSYLRDMDQADELDYFLNKVKYITKTSKV